jgi:hypothetical protein
MSSNVAGIRREALLRDAAAGATWLIEGPAPWEPHAAARKNQIVAWHRAHVTNGPTEAINNLIKRVKRVAFGFTRFRSFRIRALLYAGRPNLDLLAIVLPG